MTDKSMTVNDLIIRLQELPPHLSIHMVSPEGNLISDGKLCVSERFINWSGDFVFINCNGWRKYPKDED